LYERPHHQRIAQLLERLDATLLLKHGCLFGGGTAIALSHDEYRESLDIDFVCSSVAGYRELRDLVKLSGIDALFRRPVATLRDPRIDQYGIRCAFAVGGIPLKFEVVFEGRIALADPGPNDRVSGVWTLTRDDMVTTKLMANSDRWADDAVMSRDLLDLAVLTPTGTLPATATAKAVQAYGDSIGIDLEKAKTHLLDRDGRLRECMRGLGVTTDEADLRRAVERVQLEGTRQSTRSGKRGRRTRS
jgi:hypothetical protein